MCKSLYHGVICTKCVACGRRKRKAGILLDTGLDLPVSNEFQTVGDTQATLVTDLAELTSSEQTLPEGDALNNDSQIADSCKSTLRTGMERPSRFRPLPGSSDIQPSRTTEARRNATISVNSFTRLPWKPQWSRRNFHRNRLSLKWFLWPQIARG